MSETKGLAVLSDAELDEVAGGFFNFKTNVAIVGVTQTNASLVNILAVQSNSSTVTVSQSN
jgi:hypothetical protein